MDALLDLYADHPFWIWAGIAAALLAIEVMLGSGWLLWPAAAALAVAVLAVFTPLDPLWELLIFAVLTIASTLMARRYLPRSVQASGGDINDNVARLVGQEGYAASPFEEGRGRAFIDGKEWAAELEEDFDIERGAPLVVIGVSGSVLRVRAAR